MDSLTQAALGAALGVATMGRKMPTWKAAATGAALGTLPDLDALINHGDPIRNMTFHRAESHSLLYLTLLSPALAWLIAKYCADREHTQNNFKNVVKTFFVGVWLILITHVLIDFMTVYGTQMALPFTDYPFGVGSIFIIDPLYTLPLLIGLGIALFSRRLSALKWNRIGLWVSSAYLCWTLLAQWQVERVTDEFLAQQSWAAEKRLVTPTALNTLLWRVLVMTPDGYAEAFYSLLDKEPHLDFQFYSSHSHLNRFATHNWGAERVQWFSHGFFKMQEKEDLLIITDLRMGQEPLYFFNFVIAQKTEGQWQEVTPLRIDKQRPAIGPSLKWIAQRALGNKIDPPWQAMLDDSPR